MRAVAAVFTVAVGAGATSVPSPCFNKECGDVCGTSLGMLQVMQYCQADGSCGSNARPECPPPILDGTPMCERCPSCPGCPLFCEGENEEFRSCSSCEGTCSDPNPVCMAVCQAPKCQCNVGFVRHNGECIAADACPVRGEGEACGFVFAPEPWAGDCQEGLECLCVGACANPMIADAPSTCVRPAATGLKWRTCTRSNTRLSIGTVASQPGPDLATSCTKKQCKGVQSAADCRSLKFGNCDGVNCEGANWNSRTLVCRLCKSIGNGAQRNAGNQVALAAAQESQRASGPSTGVLAGVIGGVVGAIAASVAACVVVARRRAAVDQQSTLTAEEYHNQKDVADV